MLFGGVKKIFDVVSSSTIRLSLRGGIQLNNLPDYLSLLIDYDQSNQSAADIGTNPGKYHPGVVAIYVAVLAFWSKVKHCQTKDGEPIHWNLQIPSLPVHLSPNFMKLMVIVLNYNSLQAARCVKDLSTFQARCSDGNGTL